MDNLQQILEQLAREVARHSSTMDNVTIELPHKVYGQLALHFVNTTRFPYTTPPLNDRSFSLSLIGGTFIEIKMGPKPAPPGLKKVNTCSTCTHYDVSNVVLGHRRCSKYDHPVTGDDVCSSHKRA